MSVRESGGPPVLPFLEEIRRRGNRVRVTTSGSRERTHPDAGRKPIAEEPKPEVIPDFVVKDIDLNISNNSTDHHTDGYDHGSENETKHLVIRRGQTFDISLTLGRKYNQKTDRIKLALSTGNNPDVAKESRVVLEISEKDKKKEWDTWILKNEDTKLSLRVRTSPSCFVGKWKLAVESKETKGGKPVIFEYEHDEDIFILFNPWCKDDQVYLPDDVLNKEYVLNETGKIYVGSAFWPNARPWNFGQFQKNVLECAVKLLNQHVKVTTRGNPVLVARKLSALANCQDDDGILVGNWSGDYTGGKSPLHWTGSVAILQQYYTTGEPVCYGQCWVFSGITTTLCRTLGIPARSVTNFSSAHDCDCSTTIDYFCDKAGEDITDLNSDSVWNFHVWNDVWMSRPDLPDGYGGWQAIDGTPQECSEDVYQCGPASLEAIRRGEIYLPYDTSFVFAEVNGDKVTWEVDENGDVKPIKIVKDSVGRSISTRKALKREFGYDREDVTLQYKYQEGSAENRAAVKLANKYSKQERNKKLCIDEKNADVDFKLNKFKETKYGESINIVLTVENKSDSPRTLSGTLSIRSMYYTGVLAHKIDKTQLLKQLISPKEVREVKLEVIFDEYYPKLVDQCHLRVSAIFGVEETDQHHVDQNVLRLIKPDLRFKAPESATVGEVLKVVISFTNPLPITLTNCVLTIEAPGLQEPKDIKEKIVAANSTFMDTVELIPQTTGPKELIATFCSTELAQVDGSCDINIL